MNLALTASPNHPFLPPFVVAMVVPTGIGAKIGGFGGDAMTALNLVASTADICITHPNVANGAAFQKLPANTLYVEGYGLDQFFKGTWGLEPVRKNRIGLVLDAGMEPAMRVLSLNTLNGVKTVYGLDCVGYAETAEPVELMCGLDTTGASTGEVLNPEVLQEACKLLIAQGATALALCVQMPKINDEASYQSGQGVDPIGGLEAILSHAMVSSLKLPCAHAPVFSFEDAQPETNHILDPKVASEYCVSTFLPCVLTGLQQAPQFIDLRAEALMSAHKNVLRIDDVNALVVPGDALGSVPVFSALTRQIPIIAILENETLMNVTPESFGEAASEIITVRSYYEAVGILQALRLGMPVSSQPESPSLPTPNVSPQKSIRPEKTLSFN